MKRFLVVIAFTFLASLILVQPDQVNADPYDTVPGDKEKPFDYKPGDSDKPYNYEPGSSNR